MTMRKVGAVTPGTAKARLVATLDVIRLQVTRLPESACVVLEEARVLETIRRHVGTVGEVSEVLSPLVGAIGSIARAVKAQRRMPTRRASK